MIGTGNEVGSRNVFLSENDRFVDDSPCSVNGRSLSNAASVGSPALIDGLAGSSRGSSVFGPVVGLDGFFSRSRFDVGLGLSGVSRLGSLGKPFLENASLNVGLVIVDCRPEPVLSLSRLVSFSALG